ncbi:stage VI sporulation protein F [Salirhabdus salicampi]|uniref:stage VI sporulation protein F n=1 Tax=Salirhabdus salicampi TaxID=476102 RepID=UPI003461D2C7
MGKDFEKNVFEHIENKANMNTNDIFKIADSVKNADFSDEKTVRQLVRRLAKMANKPLPKEKEDQIVEMVTKQNVPMDMNTLQNMFKN